MLKLVKYRRETMYKRVKNLKSIFINVGCFVWTRWIVEWLLVIPGIVVYLFVVIRSVGWLLKVLGWNCIFSYLATGGFYRLSSNLLQFSPDVQFTKNGGYHW